METRDKESIPAEHIGSLLPVLESPTYDPALNLDIETGCFETAEAPAFRVWRSTDSVVLGRFLDPEEEVHMERATKLGVPVLHRPSGGGAVFHDLGNVNYSIYLPAGSAPSFRIEESLRALSFPIIEVLESYGVPWSWKPPNNIYVAGAKISGSAQARSGGRMLHHGTLLVSTDLDNMRHLLKSGGRSSIAPVTNLADIVSGINIGEVEMRLVSILARGMSQSYSDFSYAT